MPDIQKTSENRDFMFPLLGTLLTAAFLAWDSVTELGVANGVTYVAVVLLGLWAPQKWFLPAAGAAGTICTVLGYFLSPPGGELWKVLTNRALAIAVIWITAVLCSIQRKQADANVDKERRISAIVDHMYDALIVIDEDAAVVSFNPAAERCFGYAADEVVGKNVRMLMPEPYRSEHDGYIKNYLETGKSSIIGVGRELPGRRKDGSLVPMDLFLSEMFQKGRRYFIGIMRDISKRRETEDALRESEKRYRILSTAVEQSPSSVVIADSKGLVMYVNPDFTKTTGYTLEDAVGKNPRLWKSGIHPPEFYQDLWQTILSGKEWRGHICNKKKNGELYWELLSILPLRDDKNEIAYFVAVKIDDTERRKAEERTRHYAAELERSNQALQDFASIASHDLQEPLRKVMAFGDRVRDRAPAHDRKIADYLDRMQNAALRMQRFIDDLLQYSRVTTKTQPFIPTDLGEIVTGVLSDLETRIAQSQAKVSVSGLPTVQADGIQMRQLFQNLIANALKFHREDEPPVVTVAGRPGPDGFWEISVEDNGIGFDEKEAERIFKPFERLHSRSEYEGSGIGLAICRKIVERHGGTIAVHSAPQKGAKFVVALPRKPNLEENLQPSNARTI